MIYINGKAYAICQMTLAAYLAASHYDIKRIAVERNGEIVPKAQYAHTLLQEGDKIEIVSFVGGG